MDIYSRCLISIYALAFLLWSVAITHLDVLPVHFPDSASSEESVRPSDQLDKEFLVSQTNQYHSFNFRPDGNNDVVHFFNQGTFQYIFLKSIFVTAFTLLRAHDINFEFIELIFPFHYFW